MKTISSERSAEKLSIAKYFSNRDVTLCYKSWNAFFQNENRQKLTLLILGFAKNITSQSINIETFVPDCRQHAIDRDKELSEPNRTCYCGTFLFSISFQTDLKKNQVAKMVILFYLTLFATACHTSRVIDRFGGTRHHSGRCLVWYPDLDKNIENSIPMVSIVHKLDFALNFFDKYNCSFKEGKVPGDIFFHYPNGTYTGPIGMIQRNEVDTFTYAVRPDSLPFNPGLIGPTLFPADVAIGYKKMEPIVTERELTSFVTNFPNIVYAYIMVVVLIFVTYFFITENTWTSPLIERMTPKKLSLLCEQAAYSFVGQSNLDAKTTSGRIALGSMYLLVFFFVYGLFLCKIGADLVVVRDPYTIDSIEELIKNNSQTKPVITKQLFLLNLLKQAHMYRPNSTLGRMFDVIQRDHRPLIYDVDLTQNMETLFHRFSVLQNRVESHEMAVVLPQILARFYGRLSCLFNPKLASQFKTARDTFAHGILTILFSSKIHPVVRKVLEYFFRTILEMSLKTNIFTDLEDDVFMMTPIELDTEMLICQNLFQENAARLEFGDDANEWRMFFLHDYEYVFKGAAGLMAFAVIVLILEILLDLVMKNRTKRRNGIVPKKEAETRNRQKRLKCKLETRNNKQGLKSFLNGRHSL